jgi:hypothetical protein
MVAASTMDPESVSIVRDYANELLACVCEFPIFRFTEQIGFRFMMKERERFFVTEYENAR